MLVHIAVYHLLVTLIAWRRCSSGITRSWHSYRLTWMGIAHRRHAWIMDLGRHSVIGLLNHVCKTWLWHSRIAWLMRHLLIGIGMTWVCRRIVIIWRWLMRVRLLVSNWRPSVKIWLLLHRRVCVWRRDLFDSGGFLVRCVVLKGACSFEAT